MLAPSSSPDHTVIIGVVGCAGVGKTTIIQRLRHGVAPPDGVEPSWVVDCVTVTRPVPPYGVVAIKVWDTPGMDSSPAVVPRQTWRAFNAVVIVYDITNRESFAHVQGWAQVARQNIPAASPLIVLGNKLDLASAQRVVTRAEAEAIAGHNHSAFAEVSAVTASVALDEAIDRVVAAALAAVNARAAVAPAPPKPATVTLEAGRSLATPAQSGWQSSCCGGGLPPPSTPRQ